MVLAVGFMCSVGCPSHPQNATKTRAVWTIMSRVSGLGHTGIELASGLLGSLPRQQVGICLFLSPVVFSTLAPPLSLLKAEDRCEVVHGIGG